MTTPARAADWLTDPAKSTLGFTASQSGMTFEGHFTHWQAEISFDPKNPAGGIAHVVIDMASAKTGDVQRDEALPGGDWFDIKGFPQAVFDARNFRSTGGNHFDADGTLTIRGIAKTVTLPFTLDIADGTAHAKGQLAIVRTDFGVGQGSWRDGDIVGLTVTVVVDLVARAKP